MKKLLFYLGFLFVALLVWLKVSEPVITREYPKRNNMVGWSCYSKDENELEEYIVYLQNGDWQVWNGTVSGGEFRRVQFYNPQMRGWYGLVCLKDLVSPFSGNVSRGSKMAEDFQLQYDKIRARYGAQPMWPFNRRLALRNK